MLFDDELVWQALKVTTLYCAGSIPPGVIASFMLALLLNLPLRGVYAYRTIYYLPSVISGVPVALLWMWILNPEFGVVNNLLRMVGIRGPQWLFSTEWVIPAFILMSLWEIGRPMIIYLAGLQSIPHELYEAAEIDGAGLLVRFWHVTVPMVSPVILFNVVMSVIASFQTFTTAFVMTNGGPANASLFYVLNLYNNAFKWFKMGYASALAWLLFFIILGLTLLILRSSAVWVYYEGRYEDNDDEWHDRSVTQRRPLTWWASKRARERLRLWSAAILVTVGAVVMMIPLAWMVSTSLKDEGEVFITPIRWIPSQIRWQNYPEALVFVQYWRFFFNTVQVTALSMVGAVLTASLVAYAFARLRSPGRDLLFLVLLSTMMLPGEVTLVPTYLLVRGLGWLDTYLPLIVPSWLGGSPFYIFLLRRYYLTLPLELDDAAKIDGATFFDIYWRIIVPLSRPALATVTIFSFFSHWNAFQAPLIYLNIMEKYTISIGLRFYLSMLGQSHWNYLMAATLVSIIPPLLVFFFSQRYFVQGAVLTGLKG